MAQMTQTAQKMYLLIFVSIRKSAVGSRSISISPVDPFIPGFRFLSDCFTDPRLLIVGVALARHHELVDRHTL